MFNSIRQRYLDLLGSIYIYNEHRGYTAIDRVLEAVLARHPDDTRLIESVQQHRADERKHYVMFRRWFELRGQKPLFVDRTCGHIDRFVEIMFGKRIDDLDTQAVIDDDTKFEKLCRVISLTEKRGFKQVEILLDHPLVRDDKVLVKIFGIIHEDEPSHWAPYDDWLQRNGLREPKWWERAVDRFIHSELLFLKLPFLFVNPFLKRREDWPDASDPAEREASEFDLSVPAE
ncbi:ferritin-like domain-containing protein [uncultured Erythrobacter sp.]|uniref:ferritin-like domain-containing protein n=1 Tax=uncultured Erythrobacter sp. TaxID=263913 RepID=UPI002618A5A3|nr:ferritin-like domain-containing protein [uncultured Erythrobacter sp.]